jgi:hypothetical protein
MPTPTYTPLATVTLGSSASSVTFSSIPATYRDLVLVVEGFGSGGDAALMTLNGDTTNSNYSYVRMYGTGSGSGVSSAANAREIINIYTGRGTHIIQIMDYSATDKHTTSLSRSSTAGTIVMAFASRWTNTAAVTSVSLSLGGSTFEPTTVLSLYGVIA